ncbi:protein-glutamate O-methyltransferase CheR [Vagococcus fluvialis]|uniref:CheR family methyltransferase n=1 Tax=Vagococcus fluvialis TaxID=2738 RepID=UPI0032E43D9D
MSETFNEFNIWAKKNLNMNLESYKEKQLQRRILNVMSNHSVSNLNDYMKLMEKDIAAREELKNYLTINVTEFFRNPELFEALEHHLLKTLKPQFKSLKCWSAACSNGSEPYSLAMLFEDNKINMSQKILATDIDRVILKRAEDALYVESELKNISQLHRETYFEYQDDGFKIHPRIRQKVKFKEHDLLKSSFDSGYHLIICRNVTIYFKQEARDELYQKFYDSLAPGGIFFTGATETINQPEKFGFKKIDSFIYQK